MKRQIVDMTDMIRAGRSSYYKSMFVILAALCEASDLLTQILFYYSKHLQGPGR
jgi:hypothetical protein